MWEFRKGLDDVPATDPVSASCHETSVATMLGEVICAVVYVGRVVNKPVSQSLVERYFELNDLYKSTQLNDLTNQLISN